MSKFFYFRLSLLNLVKNRRTTLPYFLATSLSIAMFSILHMIANNAGLNAIHGADYVKELMRIGVYVVGLFSAIFLFYTNSYLIKRRKKEFGLYAILGLGKKHIIRMLLYETAIIMAISLCLGISMGVLLQKLLFMALLSLLRIPVPLGFSIHLPSVVITAILFLCIFALLLLNNLRYIILSQPISLLKGEQQGEREPKTKWILFLIGVIALGAGYVIAIRTKAPLDALMFFFVAVVLVIVGTYALFTAGSIVVLKTLRKNKKFYYKTPHFIGISSMLYRMKQNAAGLASICILSSAVLVMLSATVSMNIGMEDTLSNMYIREISVRTVQTASEETIAHIDEAFSEAFVDAGITPLEDISYRYITLLANEEESGFRLPSSANVVGAANVQLNFIPLEEYNAITGENKQLEPGEILTYSKLDKINKDLYTEKVLLGSIQYTVRECLDEFPIVTQIGMNYMSDLYIVVSDMEALRALGASLESESQYNGICYYKGANVGERELESQIAGAISERLKAMDIRAVTTSEDGVRSEFYALYGGLLFLGLFLGGLFLMATVLIIYYKQISEGNEDKARYDIMQKVGLTKAEIRRTIRSQTLLLFYLPLFAAAMHLCFAFQMIAKMLSILGLLNVPLFAACTAGVVLVFGAVYVVTYQATSRVYYRIVYANPMLEA